MNSKSYFLHSDPSSTSLSTFIQPPSNVHTLSHSHPWLPLSLSPLHTTCLSVSQIFHLPPSSLPSTTSLYHNSPAYPPVPAKSSLGLISLVTSTAAILFSWETNLVLVYCHKPLVYYVLLLFLSSCPFFQGLPQGITVFHISPLCLTRYMNWKLTVKILKGAYKLNVLSGPLLPKQGT